MTVIGCGYSSVIGCKCDWLWVQQCDWLWIQQCDWLWIQQCDWLWTTFTPPEATASPHPSSWILPTQTGFRSSRNIRRRCGSVSLATPVATSQHSTSSGVQHTKNRSTLANDCGSFVRQHPAINSGIHVYTCADNPQLKGIV